MSAPVPNAAAAAASTSRRPNALSAFARLGKPLTERITKLRQSPFAAALRRIVDLIPPTPLGLLLAAGAWAGLKLFAFEAMDLVWLVLGYGVLAIAGTSLLLVLAATARIALALRGLPDAQALSLQTEAFARTGFTLPPLTFVPLVRLRWQWLSPSAEERRLSNTGYAEEVRFAHRGEHNKERRRIIIEDVFGLARIGLVADANQTLRVAPHPGAYGQLALWASFASGDDLSHPLGRPDGDRIDLRPYAPGDPARFIHWKVFSRTRTLVVRKPERALSESKRTLAYLISGEDDEASAAAASVAVQNGSLGNEWLFGTDASAATSDPEAALSAIIASGQTPPDEGGTGLARFLTAAQAQGPASLVLFVPAAPGPWLQHVGGALRNHRSPVKVFVGFDAPTSRSSKWTRFFVEPNEDGSSPEALEAVLQHLQSLRVEAHAIDRRSGRPWGKR